jgi:hypothetical protein
MIISDLNYLEIVSENTVIEGGTATSSAGSTAKAFGFLARVITGGITIAIDGPRYDVSISASFAGASALHGYVSASSFVASLATNSP